MGHYSIEDRVFLVESYYSSGENITSCLRKWSSTFKNRSKPDRHTVKNLIERFERTGNVGDEIGARKIKPERQ